MDTDDSKKAPASKAQKSFKSMIRNWWAKQSGKGKIFIIIAFLVGIISILWLSGLVMPDKNAQKVHTLNEMQLIIGYAQHPINDPRFTLYVYVGGGNKTTALNDLQADKKAIDELIPQIKGIDPPDELKHSHDLILSSLEESSAAISLAIDGINTNDSVKIYNARIMDDNATTKFDEASNEIFALRYNQ